MTMSYEWYNEEELQMVFAINNNNDINVVSDLTVMMTSNDVKNISDKDIDDKVEKTPKTTINAKVVLTIKKLQALYNDDANKIIKKVTKEKSAIKNLNFLINLL